MNRIKRVHLALAGGVVALVAVAAVSITAMAATPSPTSTPGSGAANKATACASFHDYFVKAIGKSSKEVDAAFATALGQTLADQVKAGTLTQAQADAIKQRSSTQSLCGPGLFGGERGGASPGDHMSIKGPDAIAQALGISPAELQADFAKGMTIHQIADSKGISQAQFTTALQAAQKAELDAAVKAGKISQAQADKMLQGLAAGPAGALWDSNGAHRGGRGMMPPALPASS